MLSHPNDSKLINLMSAVTTVVTLSKMTSKVLVAVLVLLSCSPQSGQSAWACVEWFKVPGQLVKLQLSWYSWFQTVVCFFFACLC